MYCGPHSDRWRDVLGLGDIFFGSIWIHHPCRTNFDRSHILENYGRSSTPHYGDCLHWQQWHFSPRLRSVPYCKEGRMAPRTWRGFHFIAKVSKSVRHETNQAFVVCRRNGYEQHHSNYTIYENWGIFCYNHGTKYQGTPTNILLNQWFVEWELFWQQEDLYHIR